MKQLYIAISLFVCIPLLCLAEDPVFLNSKDIPTAAQVLKEWTPLPRANPYNVSASLSNFDWNGYAKMIAYFEKHLPDVHYATLGRDASLAGWLLDSFYTQAGLPNRVTYLRGSGGTIRGMGSKLANFLESAGLDLNPGASTPPWVIVDSIGNGVNSQVGQIVTAGVNEYVRRGGRKQVIEQKLMGFGIDANFPDKIESANFNPGSAPFLFSSLIQIPRNNEWHQGYGSLNQYADGWYGSPSALGNIATRRAMAGDFYEVLKATSDPKFLQNVQTYAKSLGYTFSTNAKKIEPAKPKTDIELKNELTAMFSRLQAKDKASHGLSTNGRTISNWLQNAALANGNNAVLLLLPFINEAKKNQQIGTQDIRSLMVEALRVSIVDPQFIHSLNSVLKDNSRVKRVFEEESEFLLKSEAVAVQNFNAIVSQTPRLNNCLTALKQAGKI